VGVSVLVGWRIYVRVRRLVGRQRFRPVRAWFALVVFPALVLALLAGVAGHPERALCGLAGVIAGIALAAYGLRLTKFESTPAGLYYTPNAHIGIALSLLFVARIAWRFVQMYDAAGASAEPPAAFMRSPATLLVLGALAGYYASYAFGLLRWQRSLRSRNAVK